MERVACSRISSPCLPACYSNIINRLVPLPTSLLLKHYQSTHPIVLPVYLSTCHPTIYTQFDRRTYFLGAVASRPSRDDSLTRHVTQPNSYRALSSLANQSFKNTNLQQAQSNINRRTLPCSASIQDFVIPCADTVPFPGVPRIPGPSSSSAYRYHNRIRGMLQRFASLATGLRW